MLTIAPGLLRPLDHLFVRNNFRLNGKDALFWAIGRGIRLATRGKVNHVALYLGNALDVNYRIKDLGSLGIPPQMADAEMKEISEFLGRREEQIRKVADTAKYSPGRGIVAESSAKGCHITFLDSFFPDNQWVDPRRPLWTDPGQPDQFFRAAIEQLGLLYDVIGLGGFLLSYAGQKVLWPLKIRTNWIDEKRRVVCSEYVAECGRACKPAFLYLTDRDPDLTSPENEYRSKVMGKIE